MKSDKKIKWILIGIIAVIIFLIILIVVLNSMEESDSGKTENATSNAQVEDIETGDTQTEENEELIRKLKKVSEPERIRTYLGTYFKHIENKEYDKAYELLYQEFKNNYFPTIEEFEKYIKEQEYHDMLSIEYKDITTQGELYIVTVKVKDFLTNSDMTAQEETLIVKENDYNDYYISFKK